MKSKSVSLQDKRVAHKARVNSGDILQATVGSVDSNICQGYHSRTFRQWQILLLGTFALFFLMGGQPVGAHGGVVIDGGRTNDYEWAAMASPFPVTPGEVVVTVLVYDSETYAPINGLATTMYLAPPDSPEPCCQGEGVIGPLPLIVDPELYPGDYSNIVLLPQAGKWRGKFSIEAPGAPTDFFFTLNVKEAQGAEPRPTPESAAEIALTATALAASVESPTANSALQSPLKQVDGLAVTPLGGGEAEDSIAYVAPESGSNLSNPAARPGGEMKQTNEFTWVRQNSWLLAALTLIPLLLLVVWFLRFGLEEDDLDPGD